MRRSMTACLATLAIAVSMTGALSAWGGPVGRRDRTDARSTGFGVGERPLLKCLGETFARLRQLRSDLDLTPEQKRDIAGILQDDRDEIVDAVQNLHDKRKTLMRAIRADDVDERAIRRAARDLTPAVADASVLRAQVRHRTREVLTADQRDRVDDAIDEIEQMWDKAIEELGAR